MNKPNDKQLSPNNKKLDGILYQSILLDQINTLCKAPEVIKKVSATIKNSESGDFKYLPVIFIYHPQTKLVILIRLPELTFLSLYCLDEGQEIIFEQLNFIPPRYGDIRKVDLLVKEKDIESKIAACFRAGKEKFEEILIDVLKSKERFS
uniref:hypothetical protein n=1 Tax=Navicula avium TaxID=2018708 RepID=UPI0021824FD0|nr:hypothetical protein N4L39_pgp044 [Haslea avium]UVG41475.1 hypothetical protein [Haslea avium]